MCFAHSGKFYAGLSQQGRLHAYKALGGCPNLTGLVVITTNSGESFNKIMLTEITKIMRPMEDECINFSGKSKQQIFPLKWLKGKLGES